MLCFLWLSILKFLIPSNGETSQKLLSKKKMIAIDDIQSLNFIRRLASSTDKKGFFFRYLSQGVVQLNFFNWYDNLTLIKMDCFSSLCLEEQLFFFHENFSIFHCSPVKWGTSIANVYKLLHFKLWNLILFDKYLLSPEISSVFDVI